MGRNKAYGLAGPSIVTSVNIKGALAMENKGLEVMTLKQFVSRVTCEDRIRNKESSKVAFNYLLKLGILEASNWALKQLSYCLNAKEDE